MPSALSRFESVSALRVTIACATRRPPRSKSPLAPYWDTLIERHVFAAERLHGDDTTIPVRAKSRCRTGRVWVYVCDDRPYGGSAPPAARYYASGDRRGEHPQRHLAKYGGLLQTDCYNGFEPIAVAATKDQPITFAFCHAHARRKFFELADIEKSAHDSKRNGRPISPVALEAVKRFDALFEIERQINGLSAEERLAVRQEKSKPLLCVPYSVIYHRIAKQ